MAASSETRNLGREQRQYLLTAVDIGSIVDVEAAECQNVWIGFEEILTEIDLIFDVIKIRDIDILLSSFIF